MLVVSPHLSTRNSDELEKHRVVTTLWWRHVLAVSLHIKAIVWNAPPKKTNASENALGRSAGETRLLRVPHEVFFLFFFPSFFFFFH